MIVFAESEKASKAAESEGRVVRVIKGGGGREFLCTVNEVIWLVKRKVTDPSLASTRHPSVSAFLPLSY